jgi:multisubunit Na+/H+ antiporter MnhF subunit
MTFQQALDILIGVLSVSFLLCFIRLYIGPDVPNRTVAFDTIAVHAVGMLALFGVRINAPALVDVAIVTAVLGFLGTTMLARYLERGGMDTLQTPPAERSAKRSAPRRSSKGGAA